MRTPIFEVEDNFDEQKCLLYYGNNYDFYLAILEKFLNQGKRELYRIIECMMESERDDYRILVHGLKSSADSVGAKQLKSIAEEMDALYKAGDWDGVEVRHPILISEYSRVLDVIEKRIKSL